METQPLTVLCVVVVIGLAGCSGISPLGGNTSDAGTVPSPETTEDAATADKAGSSYPPGYAESGITDPGTAADQHRAALSEHDTHTRELTIVDNAPQTEIQITTLVDDADERAHSETTANRSGNQAINLEEYHEDGVTYEKSEMDIVGETYNTSEEPFSSFEANRSNVSDLDGILENITVENARTVTRDDETLYRYNATDVDEVDPLVSTVLPTDLNTVKSFDGTLLVDEEGLIRQFWSTTTYTEHGETRNATMDVRFTDLDSTTVEEPNWLEEANAAAESNETNP